MSNSNNKNNSAGDKPKLTLWQRWKMVPPKTRIYISFGMLVLSSVGLSIELLLKDEDSPLRNTFNRKDTTYITIDYTKPKDQRVTKIRNGMVVQGNGTIEDSTPPPSRFSSFLDQKIKEKEQLELEQQQQQQQQQSSIDNKKEM
ncbi:hypothetical protein DFA_03359 [Cavenderia fasciculata]|uniref:Uncharacterized protein n=1 Tax=Cavenderia fasciculata TaxID=261658 RepID=F4PHC9_CACFS|nr:uncharacterized protein DFA_03359 [Cavenderia fasciculata]EGG25113.1 hypothetical protein DFA_03359 [Cavenderia fasciculata]|eukprot:XP_004362964.1 hypothetical protein DFA_03359 [Cavenderia fasciculata]